MDITLLLSSSVLAGLVAGLVTIRAGERKIQIENVTQERAKWRAKIRELSLAVHQAAMSENSQRLGELGLEFTLLLNPIDDEDKTIPVLISQLADAHEKNVTLLEFRERITLLLKHDWERAKHESFSWFYRKSPCRLKYNDFKKNKAEVAKRSDKGQRKRLIIPFLGVMLSTGLTFFLVIVMKEPFVPIIKRYNADFYKLSPMDHIVFILVSAFIGLIWTPLYLWFKGSEKVFLDRSLKKDR